MGKAYGRSFFPFLCHIRGTTAIRVASKRDNNCCVLEMSRVFFNSLFHFILVLAFNHDVVRAVPQPTTTHSSSIPPSQCHVYPTTAPVIYTALDGSRAAYSGPPQLTSTSLYYGAIVNLEVFTLVAVQIPQYATTPGAWTIISTTNTWGQQTTQAVGSNGWGE